MSNCDALDTVVKHVQLVHNW